LNIIIGCENSQKTTMAFRLLGHDAYSCDILPTTGNPSYHIQDDILNHLDDGWDMAIFHPDCTYLCSSGLHWNNRIPGRAQKTLNALGFVNKLLKADIDRICLENPIGRINTAIRKPNQYIQPHEYGHDASKKTGLWLKGLPKLIPTKYIKPRIVNGLNRWANQTDSGQNRLGPSADRWKLRAETYQGWSDAMAEQWG